MYTSSTRLTGLASGTDTDTYVKQLMFAASTKYYNQQRKLQKLQWKQSAYRTAASTINSFQSKWLDLTSSTSMRLNSTFNSKFKAETTTSTGAASNAISVSGITGNGSHTVKVEEVASAARIDGASVVSGKISDYGSESSFKFSYKGTDINITVAAGSNDTSALNTIKESIYKGLTGNDTLPTNNGSTDYSAIDTALSDKGIENISVDDGVLTVKSSVAGRAMSLAAASTTSVDNDRYTVTFNGETTKFDVNKTDGGKYSVVYDKQTTGEFDTEEDALNAAFAGKYGSTTDTIQSDNGGGFTNGTISKSPVTAKADTAGNISIEATAYNSYNITSTTPGGGTEVTNGSDYTIKYDGKDDFTFSLTKNEPPEGEEATYTIKFAGEAEAANEYKNLSKDEVISKLNAKLETAFGKVTDYTLSDGNMAYTSEQKAAVTMEWGDDGNLKAVNTPVETLGTQEVNPAISSEESTVSQTVSTSNFDVIKGDTKTSTSASITSLIGNFQGTKTVTLNNESIVIDSDTTIQEFANKITQSDAGVKMTYNSVSGAFSLETKETGASQSIEFGQNDDTADIFKALGFDTSKTVKGSDAVINIDGVRSESTTNKLSFDEFTADITNAVAGETYTINSSRDVDSTYTMISDFVKGYNEMISSLRSTVNENRSEGTNGYYEPLTDQEKKEMKEEEITKWETEAKKGILHNDQILKNFLSTARQSLYNQTTTNKDGKTVGIYSYGITTSSDMTKAGELVLDETKLREALSDDPDAVINLVKGMAERLNSTIKSYTGTNGLLATKAGIEGTSSEYQNSLLTDINSLKDKMSTELTRLKEKEESYYKMFSQMESLVSKNNSNLDALYSFMG